MSISYAVDNFQIFRGMLYLDGWCAAESDVASPSIQCDGIDIEAYIERVPRADVLAVFPRLPKDCGFRIRAIISHIAFPEKIVLVLKNHNDLVEVERPFEPAAAHAYSGLGRLNAHFFERVSTTDDATVLEIGARARSGLVRKSLFGDQVRYVGFDIREGENVDVVGDAHALSSYFNAGTFDFAYSVSVFEHLAWPWKVALELSHVMKPGGLALMQSHAVWPKHEMPWDFFRFWDSGWRALFCDATGFRVLETDESHPVDLVARPFTGGSVHAFEGQSAYLASSVLAEKVSEPTVSWNAVPKLDFFGAYPH